MDLTDAQWAVLEPLFRPKRRADGRGRPWQDTRAVLNGVFWVLRTGAPWHDLPDRYPPYQTCHRRFQQWQRDGTLKGAAMNGPTFTESLAVRLLARDGIAAIWQLHVAAAAAYRDGYQRAAETVLQIADAAERELLGRSGTP